MEKIFKKKVSEFFQDEIKEKFPDFKEVKPNKDQTSVYQENPIFIANSNTSGLDYFIAVIPIKGALDELTVECGWKEKDRKYPVANFEFDRIFDTNFSTLQDMNVFAVRLFRLCTNRGSLERFWSLYSSSIWNGKAEDFQTYAKRATNEAFENSLKKCSEGLTQEYVNHQVDIVCSDIIKCLGEFGIPFLRSIAKHKLNKMLLM